MVKCPKARQNFRMDFDNLINLTFKESEKISRFIKYQSLTKRIVDFIIIHILS